MEELMEEIKQLDPQESELILNPPSSWREKGIAEGIQKEKRQMAIDMLKEGLSLELIAKVTKFSCHEIEDLKETL